MHEPHTLFFLTMLALNGLVVVFGILMVRDSDDS